MSIRLNSDTKLELNTEENYHYFMTSYLETKKRQSQNQYFTVTA